MEKILIVLPVEERHREMFKKSRPRSRAYLLPGRPGYEGTGTGSECDYWKRPPGIFKGFPQSPVDPAE